MNRRHFIATFGAATLAHTNTIHAAVAPKKPTPLFVTMIFHFDYPWYAQIQGFRDLSKNYPQIKWTHLFNPVAYTGSPGYPPTPKAVFDYIKEEVTRKSEIGMHIHMYEGLVQAAGVVPLSNPHLNLNCQSSVGYSFPITAYKENDVKKVIEYSLKLFKENLGGSRPVTFCPGFFVTNAAVQRQLSKLGFKVSAAAFPSGNNYGSLLYPSFDNARCWNSEWGPGITESTQPYRISKCTILPGGPPPYLDMIELPQTCKIDALIGGWTYLQKVFDLHYDVAKSGTASSVCFAVHDVHVADDLNSFNLLMPYIKEKEKASGKDGVSIQYATAFEVANHFRAIL